MKKVILGAILAAACFAANAGIVLPNCMSDCATQNIGASPCVAAGTCGVGGGLISQTSAPPPACTWQNETGNRLLQKASWMRCQFRRGCSYGPPVGPTYTNTTGKTIYVQVAYGYPLQGFLNGNVVTSGDPINLSVAPGDSYSVYEDNSNTYYPWVPNPQASSWLECR